MLTKPRGNRARPIRSGVALVLVAFGGFAADATTAAAQAPKRPAALSARFTYTSPKGYRYRIAFKITKPTVASSLGDPGQVIVGTGTTWASATVTNMISQREAPLLVYNDRPETIRLVAYHLLPAALRSDVVANGICGCQSPKVYGDKVYFTGEQTIGVGATLALRVLTRSEQPGLFQHPTLHVAESRQAAWKALLAKPADFYVVEASQAAFGNIYSTYACQDGLHGVLGNVIGAFSGRGTSFPLTVNGCGAAQRWFEASAGVTR